MSRTPKSACGDINEYSCYFGNMQANRSEHRHILYGTLEQQSKWCSEKGGVYFYARHVSPLN